MANFLGRLQTFLFGAAIGRASSDAVTPVLEPVRQHAWEQNQNRVLDPGTAAEAVAQRIITQAEGQSDAGKGGISPNRLGVLIRAAQSYPGVGELRRMFNRGKISEAQVDKALAREKIPDEYHAALKALFVELLEPADLARAIHRGLIPDPGLLEGELPQREGNVPAYPVYDIDALAEALAYGIDRDRLGVLVGLQGNPMGAHEAAQAYFRHILTNDDYLRALAESNTRNEWAEAIREQSRQIPTARDFFENALRGYHEFPWAVEQAKRHGMSEADATVIYQNQGRPMNIHAITQALARGAKFNPEPGELTDPYKASIVEGNVKPAYYELAESLKYILPSVFVMRGLTEAGTWSEAKAAERLKWAGWFPPDADEAAAAWAAAAPGASGAAGSREKLATTQAVASLKRRFIADLTDTEGALRGLELVGESVVSAGHIVEMWALEKGWTEKILTPAQVKKAYRGGTFTQDDAVAQLVERHYSAADALVYLTT